MCQIEMVFQLGSCSIGISRVYKHIQSPARAHNTTTCQTTPTSYVTLVATLHLITHTMAQLRHLKGDQQDCTESEVQCIYMYDSLKQGTGTLTCV